MKAAPPSSLTVVPTSASNVGAVMAVSAIVGIVAVAVWYMFSNRSSTLPLQ